MKRCVIFCGGGFDRLAEPIRADDLVIAADSGYAYLRQLGLVPGLIVGDFDSLGYAPEGAHIYPAEKDDTDAMLAVRAGLAAGCREFVLYGALDGERVDHTVASFQLLAFLTEHGARGTLVGLRQCATAVRNAAVTFPGEYRGGFSVFCLGADASGVCIRGGKYELSDAELTAAFPLGVSNRFQGTAVEVSVATGRLLIVYDRQPIKTVP